MSSIEIVRVDFSHPSHTDALVPLINEYACDPMGGGEALSQYSRENLVCDLEKRQNALLLMAFDGDKAVALTICFEGFSTFRCKPLLNIHDVMVSKHYRHRSG